MNAETLCVCGHHAEEHVPQWGCTASYRGPMADVACRCAEYEAEEVPF
jgi:hypothetical protein